MVDSSHPELAVQPVMLENVWCQAFLHPVLPGHLKIFVWSERFKESSRLWSVCPNIQTGQSSDMIEGEGCEE